MQIKYRITIAYTAIVTVILLLLCGAVYFFSYKDRVTQFQKRLKARALSIAELMKMKEFDMADIRRINKTAPSLLAVRSIYVFDSTGKAVFADNAQNAEPIAVTPATFRIIDAVKTYFFTIGNRDAVAIENRDARNKYYVVVAAHDSDTEVWLDKLRLILFICFVSSILLVIVSGYIFSLGLVHSITVLIQKINRISSNEFSARLDTGQEKDELQKLAKTVNDLLDRLQSSFDTQRRFIDNASHELSTPLTSIYSQLDVALQKERDVEGYKKYLLSVRDDVKRLSLMVRSLLELAKASGSVGGLELSMVRIDELLMRLPAEIKKISPFYEVKLEFEEFPENESSFAIYGNEALLFIAFKNMVHNACKYSKNTAATVRLSFTDKHIIVKIEDEGIGIEKEDLEDIFQPFYRGGKYNNIIPGAGLGLALVHHIIGLHNGHIEVNSEVGAGSVFTVYLPL
jgi:two-component system sensor histidine kinase ArlS